MAEGVRTPSADHPGMQQVRKVSIPGDLAQADDDPYARQGRHLRSQVRRAVTNLLRQRLVPRRRAPHHRANPCMPQPKPIRCRRSSRLRREPKRMQNRIQEGTGTVSGKRTSGAVGPVGSRCQTKDQKARSRIPKSWHRPRPVRLVNVRPSAHRADRFTVGS